MIQHQTRSGNVYLIEFCVLFMLLCFISVISSTVLVKIIGSTVLVKFTCYDCVVLRHSFWSTFKQLDRQVKRDWSMSFAQVENATGSTVIWNRSRSLMEVLEEDPDMEEPTAHGRALSSRRLGSGERSSSGELWSIMKALIGQGRTGQQCSLLLTCLNVSWCVWSLASRDLSVCQSLRQASSVRRNYTF